MHLDGARLLNAMVETKQDVKEYAAEFDTVSFCLSKGLGCPIGSILMGSEKEIWEARNLRKMLGGGMRQAGMTASCALVGLDDWEAKLGNDNSNAKFLAEQLSQIEGVVCNPDHVETNFILFQLDEAVTSNKKNKSKPKL